MAVSLLFEFLAALQCWVLWEHFKINMQGFDWRCCEQGFSDRDRWYIWSTRGLPRRKTGIPGSVGVFLGGRLEQPQRVHLEGTLKVVVLGNQEVVYAGWGDLLLEVEGL